MIESKNTPIDTSIQEIVVENVPDNQEIAVEHDVKVIEIHDNAPEYEGEYEVTPKFVAQTLPTADKILTKDLTIEEIPYTEVTNNSGGKTVTIG